MRVLADDHVMLGPARTQKLPLAPEHATASVLPDFTPTSTLAAPVVVPAWYTVPPNRNAGAPEPSGDPPEWQSVQAMAALWGAGIGFE
jgi:hypothetical protein